MGHFQGKGGGSRVRGGGSGGGQKRHSKHYTYVEEPYTALNDADALLLVTEWNEFKLPDFDEVTKRLKNKIVFDGRNVYDKNEMAEMGYEYHCIGTK